MGAGASVQIGTGRGGSVALADSGRSFATAKLGAETPKIIRIGDKIGEHRIGKDFRELLNPGALRPVGGEGPEVDIVDLGKTQKHLRGHRPLVALEMVEVARRDADLGRHGALVDPKLPPQPADAASQIELSFGRRHGRHIVIVRHLQQVAS